VPQKSSNSGFSVLEMLVALAFMGTIVSVLVTLSNSWLHIQDRGKKEIALLETLSLGLDLIRRDIGDSRSYDGPRTVASPRFVGSTYALTMPGFKSGRDVLFEYNIQHPDGLGRREIELINGTPSGSTVRSHVLPPTVQYQFSYIDALGVAHAQWDAPQLPLRLLITLRWPTPGHSSINTVELRFPEYLPAICAQVRSMEQCTQRVKNGNDYSQTTQRSSSSMRNRRNR
jgi:general secretion pathway protein J